MYKLHATCLSGNCFKPALTMDLLGVPWEPVAVDYLHGQTRTAEWFQVNEMGEVPVLEDDGLRISQSAVILLHLARKHGRLGGATEDEQREVLRWLFFDNHKFTSYYATYRWLHAFNEAAPDPGAMAFLRGRFQTAFGIVDKHLQGRDFVVGDAPTIADLSMCGYLFFPSEETGYDVRERHPAIGRWLQRIEKLPGWRHPYECLPGERVAPRRR